MKPLLLALGVMLATPLFADPTPSAPTDPRTSVETSRESLREARAEYRKTIQTHGPHSPEADEARTRLRESRRMFHARRRAADHR